MSRKSSRLPRSQSSSSQNSRSQRNESCAELTQTRITESFLSQTDIDDQINNCVRYFINNAGQNVYFRRAEVYKHAGIKSGQQFQQIIEKTATILKNVYGYNLLVCDQNVNSSKAYILSNALPYVNYNINKEETSSDECRKILLLFMLSHIFMSNGPVTESSLYSFLKHLSIDPDKRHSLFGNVKDYITNILVKQKYLLIETDAISKKITFAWGIRAEKEISKHEILKFVCKIYKDRQPKSWTNQFKAADEQVFENDKIIIEENGMEVDDN